MTLAWEIRARRKTQDPPVDINVMPLEGVWTLPGIPFSEDPAVRARLEWSMQIVQPDNLTWEELEEVRATAMKKKPALVPLADARLERVPGGPAATMLHVGPFVAEPGTTARIHDTIRVHGGESILGHREIYLSDVRRTAPERLKTILRVAYRQ